MRPDLGSSEVSVVLSIAVDDMYLSRVMMIL